MQWQNYAFDLPLSGYCQSNDNLNLRMMTSPTFPTYSLSVNSNNQANLETIFAKMEKRGKWMQAIASASNNCTAKTAGKIYNSALSRMYDSSFCRIHPDYRLHRTPIPFRHSQQKLEFETNIDGT